MSVWNLAFFTLFLKNENKIKLSTKHLISYLLFNLLLSMESFLPWQLTIVF